MLEREKLRARLRMLVAAQYTAEEIVDEGRLLVRLGLLEAGTPYDEVIYSLLEEQILGLYDPQGDELLLLEGSDPFLLQGTLVHELTHAVQDQNFDLSALSDRKPGAGDRNAALEAVAEGDALLMEQVLSGLLLPESITAEQMKMLMKLAPIEGPAFAKAPGFIRSVLLFPYLYGFVLARSTYARGGYEAVNELFRNPPASTEQVLHPERLGTDPPLELGLGTPGGLAGLYRVAADDVLGEYALSAWLEEWIGHHEAVAAAAGWGGDRYIFLWPSSKHVGEGHLGHGVLVLVSTWDRAGDDDPDAEAAEFASALDLYLSERYPDAARTHDAGTTSTRITGEQVALIERRGRTVLFVEGLPEAPQKAIHAVTQALWTGATGIP